MGNLVGRLPGPSQASVGQASDDHPQLATESICRGQGSIVQGFHLLRSQDLFRNGSCGMQSAFPPSIMIPSTVLDQHKYLSFLCKRMAHPITRLQKMAYWIVLFENQMIRKIIFFVDKSYHPLWRFTIEM